MTAIRTLTVIDNFYEEPDKIRYFALKLQYRRSEGDLYTGRRATNDRDWALTIDRLQRMIDEPVVAPRNGRQGSFVLALEDDEQKRLTRVHADRNRWTAIVYLSRLEDCRGGTAWYRHKATGAARETAEWIDVTFRHLSERSQTEITQALLEESRDLNRWNEVQRVNMVYNRCILFLAEEFHAVVNTFGNCPENGRLTQSFEFYAPGSNEG
jgi:hypothetical protein